MQRMSGLSRIYRPSLALLTDLYELTMAQGYWKLGRAEEQACFAMYFRELPFGGGYAVACGLALLVDFIERFRFAREDLAYLAKLEGNDGERLFDAGFLEHLEKMRISCDVEAMAEGTAVFAHEPLVRVTGPLLEAQLLETAVLNLINFSTLVATKAARICQAAGGDPVVEFGLRRAQGIDGGLTASRAAYVGGCAGTSNVLAGQAFGIPVSGTHAHSWVMSFADELTSFEAYALAMPNNCIFLVDTYDTLAGVRRAAQVGRWLKNHGHKLGGIRLDSGDLAYLSIEARKILDEAGLAEAKILASNDLDEKLIRSLKDQGAMISLWGVGTQLATAYDQPALGGVYKLGAIRQADGRWREKIKLSEQSAKINTPGLLRVRRYHSGGRFVADMIYDQRDGIPDRPMLVDPQDPTRRRAIAPGTEGTQLLERIFEAGRRVYEPPSLEAIRARRAEQLGSLHPAIRRFEHPHRYPVGLAKTLYERKTDLVLRARNVNHEA